MRFLTTPLSRRRLIRSGSALPMVSLIQPATPDTSPTPSFAGSRLRVLVPEHPLSSWNDAIRALSTNWAASENVAIELDIVQEQEIPNALTTGLDMGTVHDLIGTNQPMLHRAADLINLAPLYQEASSRFGPAADACNAATRLPDGTRPAFSIAYTPAPLIYRRSIWERYGLPQGPGTWAQLHETGTLIWKNEGMSVGFGLAPEPGSERFAAMLLSAFGSSMLDVEGNVALDTPEAVEAVSFAAALYQDAMTPESLEWDSGRPATLLSDGIVSIISGDISAYRLAQARNTELANDLFLAPPPAGPAGTMFPSSPPSSFRAFHIPREAANPGAARALLLQLVQSSEILVGGSRLADRPAYGSLVPGLVQTGGWLENDPYGSVPADKLSILTSSAAWTAHAGAPGPARVLAARAGAEFLLSHMLSQAATGEMSAEDAVAEAARRLQEMDGA